MARRGPGWVPQQHGAWVMLVLPLLVGALRSGPTWGHLLLLVAWLAAYLAFHATGLWLRSRRKARWWPPVRAYTVVTAALGVPLLLMAPRLLGWAVVFLPLLVASMRWSALRQDRSVRNDLVTVLAATLMTVVATGLGSRAVDTWLPGAAGATAPSPDGSSPAVVVWCVTAVVLLYLAGTVFYVKTMIRERGNRAMLTTSIAYHAAATAVVAALALGPAAPALPGPALTALFALLTLRAVVVPRRWPGATPKQVGLGEIVASVALAVLLVLP